MVDIFNKLIKAGLTPNTFYVLYCIKNKTKPADFVSLELEKHRLIENEWITKDFKLSDKSVIFIQEIDSYFRKKKKETSQDLMGDSFISKIKSYNELFPKLKLQSGKYARVNAKTLEGNFRWFFKEYDYDWDTILKATQRYVSEYSLNNYAYMRTAQYFIRKQNIDKSFDSDLATYCEIVMSDLDDFNYFKENVI
jgi:hypothetical protein